MFSKKEVPLTFDASGKVISGLCLLGINEIEQRCIVDTGAYITSIPQAIWQDVLRLTRKQIEPFMDKKGSRATFGAVCQRAKLPTYPLKVAGPADTIDLGGCEVDFLFDLDAVEKDRSDRQKRLASFEELKRLAVLAREPLPEAPPESAPMEPLKHVILGLGGGTFKKGGLCINWRDQRAFIVEI